MKNSTKLPAAWWLVHVPTTFTPCICPVQGREQTYSDIDRVDVQHPRFSTTMGSNFGHKQEMYYHHGYSCTACLLVHIAAILLGGDVVHRRPFGRVEPWL